MGKAKQLSEIEKAKVNAFKLAGKSNRWIADKLDRSPWCINFYIHNIDNTKQKKKRGPKPKLSARDARRITTIAAQTTKGYRRIAKEANLDVSEKTIYRALKASPRLVLEQMQKEPKLKDHHKEARYQFSDQHLTWTSEWSNVIFVFFLFFCKFLNQHFFV